LLDRIPCGIFQRSIHKMPNDSRARKPNRTACFTSGEKRGARAISLMVGGSKEPSLTLGEGWLGAIDRPRSLVERSVRSVLAGSLSPRESSRMPGRSVGQNGGTVSFT